MIMQDIEQTQTTQSKNEATDTQIVLPWVPPKIEVYNEKELLKAVPALGCQLQST